VSGVRVAARLAGLVGWLLVCLILHGTWRLFRRRSPWPPRFLGGVARISGVRASFVGSLPRGRVLIVANHCSWLDIMVLGGATGAAFLAKGELASVPLVGWLCRLNRTIFIDRSSRAAIPQQIADMRAALEAGPVAIFPEGTTSDGVTLLPFKPALFQSLDPPPPGVVVQPVFLDWGPAAPEIAWAEALGETGAANGLRILGRRGTIPVTVHLLEPFEPAAVGDRKAVSTEARRRIVAAIEATGSPMRAV
jgi:1-acyl-sn-glycerol-3-phosphate acyltransferase